LSFCHFLALAILLKVSASVLALPVQPFFVIGVHFPFVPLRLIDLLTPCIQFFLAIDYLSDLTGAVLGLLFGFGFGLGFGLGFGRAFIPRLFK
jgi:hypothetical protein